MRMLGLVTFLLVSLARLSGAAALAPTKPSQVVTLQVVPGVSGTCPKVGDYAVDRQITSEGTLVPYTGAPAGQVLVVTGLDWETGSGMQSGEAITITLQLDPGTGSAPQLVFADRVTTSDAVGHEAGHSVAVPNVIVKSGVCLGVRISSTPPGLVFAVVHGFLTKDK